MGLDEKGEKMSKSKGNVLDPIPILQKYGGDTFRLWSASEASQGYDFRISEVKIAGTGKFLTKLWNIARFISSFPTLQNGIVKPTQTDKWILAQLSAVVSDCLNGYNEFNFFVPANKLRDFTWNIFADHYMEMSKWRAYGERDCTKDEQQAAQSTLHYCLKTLLLLFAPIIPFITDKIWLEIYGKESIHLEEFPKPEWHDENLVGATEKIVSFNSEVWKVKRSRGLSLKDGIDLNVPHELSAYARDLIAMHNLIRK
jgi:valyl-tRNA synthetase